MVGPRSRDDRLAATARVTDLIHVNGVDGVTGLAAPSLTPQRFAEAVLGSLIPLRPARRHTNAAPVALASFAAVRGLHAALDASVEPEPSVTAPPVRDSEVAHLGWGVIFAKDVPPAVQQALQPLLELRRRQATQGPGDFYREFTGDNALLPGEWKRDFLQRLGIEPGPANPADLPYYLLLVGSPTQIPFRFQEQLRSRHSVGRLHFDSTEEYANYAANVVATEEGRRKRASGAAFFGPNYEAATEESCTRLVQPLARWASTLPDQPRITTRFGRDAHKQALLDLLGGAESPALLFAASHGISFDQINDWQLHRQGALVRPDDPSKLPDQSQIFTGADVAGLGDLNGMVAFLFACFAAGTPLLDDFSQRKFAKERQQIAAEPFVADLPKRLLGRPDGAQAVIGHVDRAWNLSFDSLVCYRRLVRRLLAGHTVGHALEPMSWRYLDLSSDLSVLLEELRFGAPSIDAVEMAKIWVMNNDARDLVILGDPAVRAVDPVR